MELGGKAFTMLSRADKKENELALARYCTPEELFALAFGSL